MRCLKSTEWTEDVIELNLGESPRAEDVERGRDPSPVGVECWEPDVLLLKDLLDPIERTPYANPRHGLPHGRGAWHVLALLEPDEEHLDPEIVADAEKVNRRRSQVLILADQNRPRKSNDG